MMSEGISIILPAFYDTDMHNKKIKVLYLYNSPREKIYQDWKEKCCANTLLYGLNHMYKYSIEARFSDRGFGSSIFSF